MNPSQKRFHFRLEAADGSGRFRQGLIFSPSRKEAEAALARNEAKQVAHTIEPEQLVELEAKEAELGFDKLPGPERLQLVMHRQQQPYKVVHLDVKPPQRDPKRKQKAIARAAKTAVATGTAKGSGV